jgi:hypothetical protein
MNNEYLFDKYEEDADFMMRNIGALKSKVMRWKEIAELLMSDNPAEVGKGRRLYYSYTEGE